MSFALPPNMPSLSLSVPTGQTAYGNVELNEDLLKHWIQRLPSDNPVELTQRYLDAMHRFNNNQVPPAQRLKLLDMYREPFNDLLFSLTIPKLNQLIKHRETRLKLIIDIAEVLSELATGYKIIVVETGKQNKNLKLNAVAQLAIYRAVEQLSFMALHAYKFYRKLPIRLFRELHQLYLLTLEADVADKEPFVNKHLKGDYSVSQRYCQLLLTSISNPYGLGSGDILRVYNLMIQLAPAAKLSLLTDKEQALAGHFYVNCLSDRTPTPAMLPVADDNSRPPTLILDTKTILTKVADLFEQADKHGPHHPAAENIKLLRQIVPYLNTSYQRKQPRLPVEGNKETFIAVGLELIHDALTQGEKLPIDNHEWLSSTWDVLNKNSYGYLVEKRKVLHAHDLIVGDFVGIFEQPESTGKLSAKLASVRWLRTDDFEQTKMGLKFIDGEAIPVYFTLENSEEKQAAFLLPEINRINQPASLITLTDTYAPNRILHIKTGKKKFNFTIKLDTLLDKNGSFERFTFHDFFE